MANEKRLIMSAEDAIATAEQELSTSRYIAECTRSPGMREIHDKRCAWLSVIVALAKKAIKMDAVEVVRCKDCKKWEATNTMRCDGYCHNPKFHLHFGKVIERCFMPLTKEDDFCSYGERREGE